MADQSEAIAEAEAVLQILESGEGSKSNVMEDFAVTVKKTEIIQRVSASEVIEMMHGGGSNTNSICLDARTPKEYDEGRIPGALNLPIFTNEERVIVGTLYKQSGRAKAMTAGMEIVRPKFESLVYAANAFVTAHHKRNGSNSDTNGTPVKIIVHCWRGGMRSSALAYLLQVRCNFDVVVLDGGYKKFRHWARLVYCYIPKDSSYSCNGKLKAESAKHKREMRRNKAKNKGKLLHKEEKVKRFEGDGAEKRRLAIARREQMLEEDDKIAAEVAAAELVTAKSEWASKFSKPAPKIVIVGGRSGSGKTRVLLALRDELGQQIIDLEGLANHNGSAFGFVGHGVQPTNQQYGNNVAVEWSKLDPNLVVFIEDEGPSVGKVSTPPGLYQLMRNASILVRLVIPQAARIAVLLHDYTSVADKDGNGNPSAEWHARMSEGARTLKKRIGKLKLDSLLTNLDDRNYEAFAETALSHYDSLYDNHIQNATGSGNGAGVRAATAIDVVVDSSAIDVDGKEVGLQILEAITRYQQ